MSKSAAELAFQNQILNHLTSNGWLRGVSKNYDRERALYPEDVIGFVQETRPDAWEKLSKQYPKDPEKALLDAVSRKLGKADPNGTWRRAGEHPSIFRSGTGAMPGSVRPLSPRKRPPIDSRRTG